MPSTVALWFLSVKLTLSMSLLAWRLRLLKNIFLLSTCISSIVMSRETAPVPTMELDQEQIRDKSTGSNLYHQLLIIELLIDGLFWLQWFSNT